ncbi:hypothetical protein [Dyadobacter sediminis]|uniref:T9SS type A sorting domain-containing protein n=1 Tax=Dyadobacter sediminis TaxID=1493691 RepID=A0A5R9KEY1_9BACT|nr:hypothetical protein [Dyadobacter sediminis]TLU94601.1 hypothetical protein FEM55_10240 [Dyadobacter sediminis]GGB89833.1 hypothetical protein GCM10011325_16610 [Dyadobacter sediminis]
MKNSLKTIALAVAFSVTFAFSSFASDKEAKKASSFGTSIYAARSGKIQVCVDKFTASKTIIVLMDKRGNTMYKEVVGKNVDKFRKSLDVSELPDGSYYIEVYGNGEKHSHHFELSEKPVERKISFE